jgi:hypothetical protein
MKSPPGVHQDLWGSVSYSREAVLIQKISDVHEKMVKALNWNLENLEVQGIELNKLADGVDKLMQFMMPSWGTS